MQFLYMINDRLLENQRLPEKREPLRFWPSEASAFVDGKMWGWGCHRKIFWSANGMLNTNRSPITSRRSQIMGKAFEEKEIELLIDHPNITEVVSNFKLKGTLGNGIDISGEIDSIIRMGDLWQGIEYKTGHGKYYRDEVMGTTYQSGFPKDNYIMQVMLYLELLKTHPDLKGKISEFEIYCMDRDKCETVSHMLSLSHDGYPVINGEIFEKINIQDIIDRFTVIKYNIESDILPRGDFTSYYSIREVKEMYMRKKIAKWQKLRWEKAGYGCDIQCAYCNYLHRCQHANGMRSGFKELK